VLIPGLDQILLVLLDDLLHCCQLSLVKSIIANKFDRVQPELGLVRVSLDVNVGRLLAFVAEEEKPKATNSQDRRHLAARGALPDTT
jgi:hypothetical protein